MRPNDPRVRAQLAIARGPLAGVLAAGILASLLVVAQAWVVTGLVVAAVTGMPVTAWALGAAALLAIRGATGHAGDTWAARAALRVSSNLRRRLVRAVVEGRPGASGEVAVLTTRGVTAVEPFLTRYVPALVLATVLPPVTVVAIATQDVLSAVIVLATLPLVPVFGALVGLATRDRAAEQWRQMGSLSGYFLDVVRGLPVLVAHRRARAQSARIAEITDRYRRASMATLRLAFASSAVLELVATLSVAVVAVTVGVRLADGSLSLQTGLVVLLLAPEAYWPLRRVGAEFHAAAEGATTFAAVHELIGREPGTGERTDDVVWVSGPLIINHLTVTHPGRLLPALSDFSGLIPDRGITAVTGRSGCGKSTLLSAIAGLVPRSPGSIRLGGQEAEGPDWQRLVAWLPQRPTFVAGSIGDNLRLARPEAGDDSLWEALRRVALEERVRALAGGLDAPLGQDGTSLSAGERARLALARILVADRPWNLLDEPTAHVDDLTERVMADVLVELGQRAAVVVVTHRPALVALADVVVNLPDPRTAVPAIDPTPLGRKHTSATKPIPPPDDDLPRLPGQRVSSLLGGLASASGVALTATAGWLIVQASTQPAVLTLLVAIVGVRLFGIARPVLRYVERLGSHDAALRLLARRRVQVYDALVPLTPARLGRRRGDLLTSVVDDVDAVVDRALRVRQPVEGYAVVALLATLASSVVLPVAGLVVGASCVLLGAAAYAVPAAGARRAERGLVDGRAALSAAVVEVVQTAPELLMWQAGDRAAHRVVEISETLGTSASRAATWVGLGRALVLSAAGAAVASTAVVASGALGNGDLSGPMVALLVLLPLALSDVALPLADAGALSARTAAAESRLTRLSRTAPAVRDTVAGPMPAARDLSVEGARGQWTRDAPLTAPVTLDLHPGDRVAVVGPSGCGKSTLAALLVRFLDPAEGTVRLGGRPLHMLSLDDVRAAIGYVDDDPHVFASTLVENVRLARPGATDEEVEGALRAARLGPWVDGLPDGLHTWVGDGHAEVSGGERARLAIARSLLADQSVLVLDEPTAHLDHPTAAAIAREVLTPRSTRAVVWITHTDVGLDLVDDVVDLARPGEAAVRLVQPRRPAESSGAD